MGNKLDSARRWTSGRLLAGLTVSVFVVSFGESQAMAAAIPVILDFNSQGAGSFRTAINQAASFAGLGANYFTVGDATAIQTGIQTEIGNVYAAFNVSFSQSPPPDNTVRNMTFADNTTQSIYGQAGYNWRNAFLPGTYATGSAYSLSGQIFSGNFDPSLFSTLSHATNVSNITIAIADTAAHELGHTFGLDHHDAYGDKGITSANYANTGGLQNTHIMASGATGLSDNRSTPRTFGPLELDKLAQSVNMLTGYTPNLIADAGNAHTLKSTAGPNAAQPLTFTPEPLTGDKVVTITSGAADAAVSGNNSHDVYSFTGGAGDLLTADLVSLSNTIEGNKIPGYHFFGTPISGIIELWRDNGGSPVLVESRFDKRYNNNNWLGGPSQDGDPMLLNFILPANDTYYLDVQNTLNSGGNYEMFVSVPEPLSISFVIFGSCTWLLRRRVRRE